MDTKTCSKCGETKTLAEFYKKKDCKFGVRADCKVCVKSRQAKYHAENRDRIAKRKAKYHAENKEKVREYKAKYRSKNKDRIAKYNSEYYDTNKEACKIRDAAYRSENRDRIAKRKARYRAENKEKNRSNQHRRRARTANAQGDHTAEQLQARFDYHGNKCVYCDSTENLHADHQIPLSRGGTNFASNMVPACASCNLSKGAKTPEEFLLQQFNIAMDKLINGKV